MLFLLWIKLTGNTHFPWSIFEWRWQEHNFPLAYYFELNLTGKIQLFLWSILLTNVTWNILFLMTFLFEGTWYKTHFHLVYFVWVKVTVHSSPLACLAKMTGNIISPLAYLFIASGRYRSIWQNACVGTTSSSRSIFSRLLAAQYPDWLTAWFTHCFTHWLTHLCIYLVTISKYS